MSAKSAQTVGATTRSFNTRIFDREAQGCDFLHTDENGLIDEFTVMVRPLSAALALAEAMKVQLEAAPRDQRHAGVLVARGSATRANQTRGWMERRVRRGRAATSVEPPARPAPGRRPSTPPRPDTHEGGKQKWPRPPSGLLVCTKRSCPPMPAAGCRSAARAVMRAPSTGSLLLVQPSSQAKMTASEQKQPPARERQQDCRSAANAGAGASSC